MSAQTILLHLLRSIQATQASIGKLMDVAITQSPATKAALCYDSHMSQQHNRRQFVREVASDGAAIVRMSLVQIPAAVHKSGVKWPIGCFNRPWTPWTYNQAIEGIKDAGFGLTGMQQIGESGLP